MGFFITSIIAMILTVAGLLTTHNWSSNRSSISSRFKEQSQRLPVFSSAPVSSFSPILLQLKPYKPSYGAIKRRQSLSRVARYDGGFEGYYGGAIEKSEFYYILPILLVIGLGSFLIPIISTFFTALVTSQGAIGGCCGRRKRRGSVSDIKPNFGIENIFEIWESFEKAIENFAKNFENET